MGIHGSEHLSGGSDESVSGKVNVEDAELNELQDIDDLLNRETGDGKGDEDVPEADFVSFATDDAEKENDK